MAGAPNINVDDDVLVQQCRHGDSAAMERLICKYQNRIYNTILKICANLDDAAELTQDTFVKVIENIEKFEGRSSFYTWAFRIAMNLTLNYCKRSSKLTFTSLETERKENNWRPKQILKEFLRNDASPDPAIVAQNRELCGLVQKALMKLDDTQRTVIVLRDIEGMNYAQIANVLELELGTVKSRISRARNNLREIFEGFLK
ncbi:MAG: RNA polymerase sigma factor [Planctomycetota bacterium]